MPYDTGSQLQRCEPVHPSMDNTFRVIIVGGSIAGLSLALCLERAGIEFVLLERHKDITAQMGATLGIMPNGARILDQLGVFDAIELDIPIQERARIFFPNDGFSLTTRFAAMLHEEYVFHHLFSSTLEVRASFSFIMCSILYFMFWLKA